MVKRLILLAILTAVGAAPAAACNCPKEMLIKEHGTVGVFAPKPLGPVRPAAIQAVTVKIPGTLPLLVPIRQVAVRQFGAGPTSLEWLLLDP